MLNFYSHVSFTKSLMDCFMFGNVRRKILKCFRKEKCDFRRAVLSSDRSYFHSDLHMYCLLSRSYNYRKNPKNSDIRKICCNHPKIRTTRLYHIVMLLKDAGGIANSVDPVQTALGLHCLPRPICPKT